jgi:hypothetical protein
MLQHRINNSIKPLYVSGHFPNIKTTELQVLPVNRNELFLKEKDVIVTSDAWRVAVDLDTQVYEDAIATVRYDLTQ